MGWKLLKEGFWNFCEIKISIFAAMYRAAIFLITLVLAASCGAIDVHPYDCDINGERDINSRNIAKITEYNNAQKEFTFAFISDTQRWYDETEDVVKSINGRGVDFVVHGGDLTDFGATKEFLWQRDILNKLQMPWVALIGNHDCLGSGEQAFGAVFGELNFHFVAGNVLFVCLNTNALEYDYTTPVPDFSYLSTLLANIPDYVTKTIFVMHARPFSDVFNNNVAEVFDHYTRRFPNVQFYLFGHEHKIMEKDLFNTGLTYYGVSNVEKRKYYLFTMKEDGYEYEIVDF